MERFIELGDEVKDTITGFKGIAVARTTWITGCDRITIQQAMDKDGKVPETLSFDEPTLIVVKKGKVRPYEARKRTTMAKTGGPAPTPQHKPVVG